MTVRALLLAFSLLAVGFAPRADACKEAWHPPDLTTQTAEAGGVTVQRCCGGEPLQCALHVTAPDGSSWSSRAPAIGSFVFPLSATVVAAGDSVVTPRGLVDVRTGFSASEWEQVQAASRCEVHARLVGLSGGRLRLRVADRAIEVDERGDLVRPAPTHTVCSPDLTARWATSEPRAQLVSLSQALDGLELEGEPPGAHESERPCVDLLLTAAREGSPTQRVAATQGLALYALRGPRTGFVLLGRVGVLTPLGRDLREVLSLYEAWYDGFTWLGVALVLAAGLTAVTRRWRVGGLLFVVGMALVGQRLWAHSNARRPLDVDDVRELLFSDAAGLLTKRAGSSCDGTPLSLRRRSDVLAALAQLQPRLAECAEAESSLRLTVQPDGRASLDGASWMVDGTCARNVLEGLVLPPAALPLEVVVAVQPQRRDAGLAPSIEPPAPEPTLAPAATPYLTERRVVTVREQVKTIDVGVAGAMPLVEHGCTFTAEREHTGELGIGWWEQVSRTLVATEQGSRLTLESTWASFNSPDVDGAGTSKREVYRDAHTTPLFVFETSTPTAGMTPTKFETRTWFENGQAIVRHHREGPALPPPGSFFSESWRESPQPPPLDWEDVVREARICDALPSLVKRAQQGDAAAIRALAAAFPSALVRH